MNITNEQLMEIFPKVIGEWNRIFTSSSFDVEEMIADTLLYSDFENVRDIVLYANDNLIIKGIIVEFIQGNRFVYTPIICDAVFPKNEVGTIEKMINGEGNWGYESLDNLSLEDNSYRDVQTESLDELKELAAIFIAKLEECSD